MTDATAPRRRLRPALPLVLAAALLAAAPAQGDPASAMRDLLARGYYNACLLYTSDAADE